MALWTVRSRGALAAGAILAPERYDPRRDALEPQGKVRLGDVALSTRELVTPTAKDPRPYLIIDTSNSREGILYNTKPAALIETVGSVKKVAQAGDVLISRLRPYLRQVAWVDAELPGLGAGVLLACSTEYFVLRSAGSASIAFLVPFLLSDGVQRVLAAAQEGGHHPRVTEETILNLPLPQPFVAGREQISNRVERAVQSYRQAERELQAMIRLASSAVAI